MATTAYITAPHVSITGVFVAVFVAVDVVDAHAVVGPISSNEAFDKETNSAPAPQLEM